MEEKLDKMIELFEASLEEMKTMNAKLNEMHKDVHHEMRAIKVKLLEIKI